MFSNIFFRKFNGVWRRLEVRTLHILKADEKEKTSITLNWLFSNSIYYYLIKFINIQIAIVTLSPIMKTCPGLLHLCIYNKIIINKLFCEIVVYFSPCYWVSSKSESSP